MPKFLFLILGLIFFSFPKPTLAISDPLAVPNNRYGIHITAEADFQDAAQLVNSNGGDWGYVTLVIREDERDIRRWNNAFNTLRKLHLIPIIRLATIQEGGGWRKPDPAKVNDWASFLNKLTWVIENRYIIVGNEPNHFLEWGGGSNPEEYAYYTCQLSQTLKSQNSNFFVISAGLDASAPDGKTTVSEETFLNSIKEKYPDYWACLDGWGSHSYPNPNFSGLPTGEGRGSIRTFLWEMDLLKKMGINNNYPIFITETGWARKINRNDSYSLSEKQIENYLTTTANLVWNNPQIAAVTPFILDYRALPFSNFSWKTDNGWVSYFKTYQDLPKTSGRPLIANSGEIVLALYSKLNIGRKLTLFLELKNTGQSIWHKDNLFLNSDNTNLNLISFIEKEIWPGEKQMVKVEISDGSQNRIEGNLFLSDGTKAISPRFAISAFMITSETTDTYRPPSSLWQKINYQITKWLGDLIK